jgi:hypothetical protein
MEDIPLEKRRQGRLGLGTLSWIFLLKSWGVRMELGGWIELARYHVQWQTFILAMLKLWFVLEVI